MENPINPASIKTAQKNLHQLGVLREALDYAEAAHIECSEERARVEHLHGLMSEIINVYGQKVMPPRPKGDN